jgi:hypothetical protein
MHSINGQRGPRPADLREIDGGDGAQVEAGPPVQGVHNGRSKVAVGEPGPGSWSGRSADRDTPPLNVARLADGFLSRLFALPVLMDLHAWLGHARASGTSAEVHHEADRTDEP